MTALFCQYNSLILETKCRTVCAILRKELCMTDTDLREHQHVLCSVADFCIRFCFYSPVTVSHSMLFSPPSLEPKKAVSLQSKRVYNLMMLLSYFTCSVLCDDTLGSRVYTKANFQGDATSDFQRQRPLASTVLHTWEIEEHCWLHQKADMS